MKVRGTSSSQMVISSGVPGSLGSGSSSGILGFGVSLGRGVSPGPGVSVGTGVSAWAQEAPVSVSAWAWG